MLVRLGNVLWWVGGGLAALFAFLGAFFAVVFVKNSAGDALFFMISCWGISALSAGVGRAAKYILAGQ